MMKKFLLSSAALSLAACASVSPPVSELTPLPSAYDYASDFTEAEKQNSRWWATFGDPSLDALIDEALDANQDIAAGLATLRAARASVRIANASQFPQLSAGASASSNTSNGLDDVSASARGSASYQLDLFGQNRADRAAARAGYDAQAFDQRALELTVASDVAFTYFSMLAARERLDVARANLEISERIYRIIETRYSAGDVSRFDLTSQQASLAASLAAPIFSGGRLEGSLAAAEARADQQIARYRQATLNALRDVDVSLSALATAEQREEQLVIARDASQQSLSLAEIRYRSGADDLTSLLNAQSTFFNASDSLVQGRLDRLSAAVDLYAAIGGGWGVQ